MNRGGLVIGALLLVSVLNADLLAPAELGVEKAVQVLQQLVARQITTEAEAVKKLGAEGATLFRAFHSLRSRGLAGNLGAVNYTELTAKLTDQGISGNEFVSHLNSLASGSQALSMHDLVTLSGPALPKPRVTDTLAVIERLAPPELDRYRFPTGTVQKSRQVTIARLLKAAEQGAQLCQSPAECLTNNIASVVELDRLGLIDRGLTVDFTEDAFLGFPKEDAPYRGDKLQPISENLRAALASAADVDAIQPAAVRSCILNGTT